MFSRDAMEYRAVPLPDRSARDDSEIAAAANAFLADMQRRHTVRDFAARAVARDVIESCVAAAGLAPSGANHQPWHFVAIADADKKRRIRAAAEAEEERFYAGGGGEEWLKALEPIGTGPSKPHLEKAPWLIVVFAERWSTFDDGTRYKNYYVTESVGIASGILVTALHEAGLVSLIHTPNPMAFLNGMLGRPEQEKPVMILAVGHPAEDATVPAVAKIKKPLEEILTVVA